MNIEEIDKWLDNEYGVSYTRLEELHDFLIEQNMKYQDKIDNLQQENKKLKEVIEKSIEYLEQKPVVMVNGEPREIYVEDDNKLLDILKKVE